MSDKAALRQFGMVLLCALAGWISTALNVTGYLRAPILGAGTALGVVYVNRRNRDRLDSGAAPFFEAVLEAGLLFGLITAALIFLADFFGPVWEKMEFTYATPKGMPVMLSAMIYVLIFHMAYALRWLFGKSRVRGLLTLLALLAAAILSGVLRVAVIPGEGAGSALVAVPFGALSFAVLWFIPVWALDPGWSLERWERLRRTPAGVPGP